MTKRVIIIGGGHNGLVCACYLARAGLDVTVLERSHVAGGAAVTEEFHPGFRNSVASYTVSLLHPSVIADLHLHEHGLQLVERPVSNFLPLPDGNSLTAYPDADRMREEVARFSARDADRITDFHDQLGSLAELVRSLMVMTPPAVLGGGLGDVPAYFRMGREFRQLDAEDQRNLLRLFAVSAGELLDDTFETGVLKALIGFDSIVGNFASPYQAGSAYVLLHHLVGEVNGKKGAWGHAVGGMGSITAAMVAEAEHLGVSIETGSTVTRVLTRGRCATGVELANGNIISGDIIVSGINPKLLYLDLLDASVLEAATVRHFERYKCMSGSFRMNVALSGLPRFAADTPNNALTGGIILAPDLNYMDRAYTDARSRGYSREPVVEMLIPSLVDSTLAPPGQHVASLFCQQFDPALGERWDSEKDAAARTIIATVDRYAPGFSDSIVGMQVLSPLDLERRFGLVGGDIFHGRLTLDQLFSARPMLGAGNYRTEISSLYMCGSGTHPGGGVSGLPGKNAAREILARI